MKTIFAPLIALIEEIFKAHAPEIVAAATSPEAKAIEQAAAIAAVQTVSKDPKVQAGIAAYQAIQNFKTAINMPAQGADVPPLPTDVKS